MKQSHTSGANYNGNLLRIGIVSARFNGNIVESMRNAAIKRRRPSPSLRTCMELTAGGVRATGSGLQLRQSLGSASENGSSPRVRERAMSVSGGGSGCWMGSESYPFGFVTMRNVSIVIRRYPKSRMSSSKFVLAGT